MSENNSSGSGGVGFFGALTILLIGLKLTGFIDWSWWWVWSPIWGPFVAVLATGVVFYAVLAASEVIGYVLEHQRPPTRNGPAPGGQKPLASPAPPPAKTPGRSKPVFYEEMLSRAMHEQWMKKQAEKEFRKDLFS